MADWRRYAAPAAFLLAVTVAVVLVRSGIEAGHGTQTTQAVPPPPTTTRVHTTTAHRSTPRRKTPAGAKRYWTVRAGDTFGVISSQTGVPVATIEQLNPGISSTSLTIGEKVRIG